MFNIEKKKVSYLWGLLGFNCGSDSAERSVCSCRFNLHEQRGFDASLKLCLNLFSCKRLKLNLNLVINLIPTESLMWQGFISTDLINFDKDLRNMLELLESRISGSNLFD